MPFAPMGAIRNNNDDDERRLSSLVAYYYCFIQRKLVCKSDIKEKKYCNLHFSSLIFFVIHIKNLSFAPQQIFVLILFLILPMQGNFSVSYTSQDAAGKC